jgi:hypothetical protein
MHRCGYLNALRLPIVKSGRGNPVPGTYATGTSHPVQFSWNLQFTRITFA